MKKHPIVQDFEWGNITAEHALKYLGQQIQAAEDQGISTKYLQAAVDAILEMPSEPKDDPSKDEVWADTYRNRG